MYCPYGNIINFSRMSQIHFCYKIRHWNHWVSGANDPKINPFPLRHVRGPHLIHECLGWPYSPPQTSSGSNQPFCHNAFCRTTDGPGECSVSWVLHTLYADREQRAKKWHIVVWLFACMSVLYVYLLYRLSNPEQPNSKMEFTSHEVV